MRSPTTPDAPSALEVRPVPVDGAQLREWMDLARVVFKDGAALTDEIVEFRRAGYAGHRLSGAYDGETVVGTFRSYDSALTVPGGSVTADAVTSVTVRPTHRRRGALSAMMRADLVAAKERGLPVAMLIASEAAIYGRFGFGAATEAATWSVDVRAARLRPDAPGTGRLDLVTDAALREHAVEVYAAARRPGAMDRGPRWWDLRLGLVTAPASPAVAAPVSVLHLDGAGRPDGFLRYHTEDSWHDRTCRTVVHVDDLETLTPAAYADLWGYLVELDLVATVRAADRPVDEALPLLLTDPRAARRVSSADFVWTRVLDVAALLSARTYVGPAAAGTVGVIEVVDGAGWATGRWSLEIAADGSGLATVTTAEPDLTLGVEVLGALWLGGGDLVGAATVGRVVEHRTGAVLRWASALRTPQAPWTSTWF